MDYSEPLGIIAGFVSTLAFLPQVLKVWRTRTTKGLSKSMYTLYSIGLFLWAIYAWLIGAWPLLITEIITGVMTGYILFMTINNPGKKSC